MFGLLGSFDNDPFFEDTSLRTRPSFGPTFNMEPFGMFGGTRTALTGPETYADNSHALAQRNDMMWPFSGRSPFDSMFAQFGQMANDPNAHTFSSSTVMSYSSGGAGSQPQVYRASKSTSTGPGGIKETRRQVQDSVSGVQKMSVGHQIGDKSHTIGKSYNSKDNEEMETHDFVNIDEDESDTFEREWDNRIHSHSFRSGDMFTGGKKRLPSQRMAISSQPYHSHDYDDSAKERKKEKRHHHRDHLELNNDFMVHDNSARTRPLYHDETAPHHHERTIEPEVDHDHYGHHSRPKAPAVGHRSSKHKTVNFPDVDEKPTRKQHHHYHSPRHTRDDHHRHHHHSTKKPSTLM